MRIGCCAKADPEAAPPAGRVNVIRLAAAGRTAAAKLMVGSGSAFAVTNCALSTRVPTVHCARATPVADVTELAGETAPPPATTFHATATSGTELPYRSATLTESESRAVVAAKTD